MYDVVVVVVVVVATASTDAAVFMFSLFYLNTCPSPVIVSGYQRKRPGRGKGVYYLFNELFTIKRFAPRSLLINGWMNV